MEISIAVAARGDKRLQAKFKVAMNVIDRTLSLYGFEEVAFSFNGGKDSTVLLHLLRAGYAAAAAPNSISPSSGLLPRIRTIYFESPDAFPEIDSFTLDTAKAYDLELEELHLDFRSGLVELQKKRPMKAVFLGTRIGDPNALGQDQFCPSSKGWAAFMRVNPILDWSYRDVWAFLLACEVPYCSLYDQGYTSIGSIYDTLPNNALCVVSTDSDDTVLHTKKYRPAYMLKDGRLERAGRLKSFPLKNKAAEGLQENGAVIRRDSLLTASVVVVGEEILRGEGEEDLGKHLSREVFSAGWKCTHRSVIPNDIDSISEEVERRTSVSDIVMVTGGVGTSHCDVILAGVAKAFGVSLVPDEEEELAEDLCQNKNKGKDWPAGEKIGRLPEGITEILHHKDATVPVIKCNNVYVFSGDTTAELGLQWRSLLKVAEERDLFHVQVPFKSDSLRTILAEENTSRVALTSG